MPTMCAGRSTSNPDVELVAVVQSETPSGIHNPVGEIAPLVRDAGALLLVDAVSALGCEEVLVDEWGIDVCVAGPQKCLAGPPGMSLMSISAAAWEAMERNPNAPRGSFVSLLDWKHGWVDSDRTKFLYTPSVVDVNGVDSVVDQVLDEGLDDVHRPSPDGGARGARGRAGDGARAVGAPRGLRGRLRHGDPGAGGHLARRRARAHPRPLRRHALRRLRRAGGQGLPHRPHGPGRGFAEPGRGGQLRSAAGLKDLGADVRIGDGVEATLEVDRGGRREGRLRA